MESDDMKACFDEFESVLQRVYVGVLLDDQFATSFDDLTDTDPGEEIIMQLKREKVI